MAANTRKRANTIERWAIDVLDEIDTVEGKSYVEHDKDNISDDVKELVEAARRENAEAETTDEWVTTWRGVLTDENAVKAKKYVAKALRDAVLSGAPRELITELQEHRDDIVHEAKEFRKQVHHT